MATEFVGIELQLRGYDGVMSDMQKLDSMLNGFRGKKGRIAIETDLAKTKREIIALTGELNKYKAALLDTKKGSDSYKAIQESIAQTNAKLRDARQRVNELNNALKSTGNTFMQNFSKVSSAVAHIGSAMQSAGNALTRLTNPYMNFVKGMAMGAGYKALNSFTSGLEKGFSRYDTMKKYPKLMAEFSTKSYTAEQSIKDLEKSVLGLPTGLDEMVDLSQRFTMTLGNMEKGTQLAIATNNAFLASMSTDTQKYQGMMQMQDVIGGKDMNAREWQALAQSMKPAIRMMGKDLGKSGKELSDWVSAVMMGKVSNEEFLNALLKTGTGTGRAAKMAEQSKDTWQAFFSNVGNAASRFAYGVIKSFDEITQAAVGKDLNAFMSENVISGIDSMTKSVKKWIKSHPDEITDFFKSLGQIDWASIAKGFAEAAINVAKGIQTLAETFGGGDLTKLGKFMVYGNILGNFLTISGGLFKGGRHGIGGVLAGILEMAKTAKKIKTAGGIKGFLEGMLAGEEGGDISKTAGEIEKGASSMGKATLGVSKVFKAWGEGALMVGGTALVGWGTFKAFKSMMKDLDEMITIGRNIDWDKGSAMLLGMGIFIGGFIKLSSTVGSKLGLGALKGGGILAGLSLLFSGSFAADMRLIKDGFKSLNDMTVYLGEATKNLKKIKQIKDIGNIKSNIRQVITSFNLITDMLTGERVGRNNPVQGEVREGGLKKLGSGAAKTVENIAASLNSMKSAVNAIKQLGKIDISGVDLTGIGDSLNSALTSVGTMLTDVPPIFTSGEAVNRATRISSVMSNMNSMLGSVLKMTKSIPKITQTMGGFSNAGTLNSLQVHMETLGETLTTIYTSLQGIGNGTLIASNLESFSAALSQVKKIIKKVKSIGKLEISDAGIGKISDIVSKINEAFDATAIDSIKSSVETFVNAVNDALDSIDRIKGDKTISVSVKLKGGKVQGLETVVSKINAARSRINLAWNTVPTSLSKTIGVHINANVDASGAVDSINTGTNYLKHKTDQIINQHTGGYVAGAGKVQYRAKGGSIFKPKGTDTVPAMLTPGEYVQRRAAVNKFGIDFMRKVNQLDIRGAMNALLTKAGAQTSAIGRQTVINNTYNNNQKVEMTLNNTSQAFAFKNASRFVGAI